MNAIQIFPQSQRTLRQVDARYEPEPHRTLWTTLLRPADLQPPYFSPELLEDLTSLFIDVQRQGVHWPTASGFEPIEYVVLQSGHPQYFSLGGDLRHFHDCIQRRDRASLHRYSLDCANMLFELSATLGDNATSIALVQGRALGGGFETVLAADYVIAEEHSEFGFPEILFGLFPCTGGMSLLSQRIGLRAAENMLSDGKIYSAATLKAMGIVDEVCATGEGRVAVENFIARHRQQRPARLMLQRARRRMAPLDLAELHQVVEEWTEIAMALGAPQLRVMEMLSRMQRGGVSR